MENSRKLCVTTTTKINHLVVVVLLYISVNENVEQYGLPDYYANWIYI